MKARTHTFLITVTMDKACTKAHALREVQDTIHGTFYPTQRADDEPGEYHVRSIKNVKAERVS